MRQQQGRRLEIVALKVHQWLKEWDKTPFGPEHHRRRPDPYFYVFSLSASELRALSGIYRRTTEGGVQRTGIQRALDRERADKIHEYVRYGYPWSDLSQAKRESKEFDDLRKPGWLPTAIVVNILKSGDARRDVEVAKKDTITIIESRDGTASIRLPEQFNSSNWHPSQLHPIEVIDGQHRLWAFDDQESKFDGDFELPVVAFHGLDISWQAYLFWTINISPKRINASLAFDLYPLLRAEDWLERFEGHSIYRQTRSQELTEALWSHPASPWYQRINMLGETGLKQVSQAAWIRSLMATYVKAWEGKRVTIGGLFGAPVGSHNEVLPWSRAQQAAFLILMGQKIQESIRNCSEPWATTLREKQQGSTKDDLDPAFAGSHTLLNTDQGIRGLLYMTNDLCYIRAKELDLENWVSTDDAAAVDEEAVAKALRSLSKQPVTRFLSSIAAGSAKYDWRTSSAPGLTDDDRTRKAAFRGSGGYKELRRQLLIHLSRLPGDVGKAAQTVLISLGY